MVKSIMLGIGIYIFGFIFIVICANIFDSGNVEYSYYYAIVFSILYLSAIVGVAASLLLRELKRNKN